MRISDNVQALPNLRARRDSCPARGVTGRKVAAEAPQGPEPAHAFVMCRMAVHTSRALPGEEEVHPDLLLVRRSSLGSIGQQPRLGGLIVSKNPF